MVKCPHCGTENEESSKFCRNCGQEITLKRASENEISEKPSTLLIVLGYVLSILGIFSLGILSVIGLIIGIVLYRKGGPDKTHGLIIMIISILILLVVIIAIFFLLVYRAYFYTPV
ncbi:MAG: zinc-ribbon domain-containing protein [Methanobacteriaceae archaeon]|nr:zinc-ribbon domain-containing protein [Methanobacteriaceae archaeon]